MGSGIQVPPGEWLVQESPYDTPVLITAGAVKELRLRTMEAFTSLPKRGAEIGGLLYGSAAPEGLRIEAFEEVPCEHRYGPSYTLSRADRENLTAIVRERRGQSPPILGFFRSFTARDALIEAVDEEFVRTHFPDSDFLWLQIQPISLQVCQASIRLFRRGELLPEDAVEPFDFDPNAMKTYRPGQQPAAEPVEIPIPVESYDLPAAPVPVLPPPYPRREPITDYREARRGSRWWIPLAICLISGVLGAGVFEFWKIARQPRWVELHLDARQAGSKLDITWDAAAAKNSGADRAILTVDDGGVPRSIEMTAAQIASGRTAYSPAHTDVGLRLILYGKGLAVSGDAVRIAGLPQVAAAPAPASPAQQVGADHIEAPVEREPGGGDPSARADVPPAPIHEVQPRVPDGIRSRIAADIVIPVEVGVNTAGRVTRVSVESAGLDGLHRYLADLAQKAAWQWRFKPGRSRGGRPIAASRTILFVFAP